MPLKFTGRKNEVRFKNLAFKAEDIEENKQSNTARIVALSAAFNNVDSYNEVIVKGAFEKTIKQNPNWNVLRFHNSNRKIGFNEEAEETSKGLKTTSLISLDTQDGREQYALSKLAFELDKAKDAQSIGYRPIKWDVVDDKKKGRITYLKEIEMWEHSFVTWGANEKAFSTGFKQWTPEEKEGYGLTEHVDDFFMFMEELGYGHSEVKQALTAERKEEIDGHLLELMTEATNIFKKKD